MSKSIIIIVLLAIITLVELSSPIPVHAFSFDFVGKIVTIAKYVKTARDTAGEVPHRFVFGGHVTHAEGGCHVKYTVLLYNACFGFPCPPFPGVPIPIGGNTIEVGPPLSSPSGQIFTFPFISDVYANHNEDKVSHWALGIGYTPFPIDKINDALDKIPPIPIPDGQVYDFSLECSDSNKNVVLKMGTS